MEKRKLGKHEDMLSVVGFGGICVKDEKPETAKRIVTEAIDRGINYFDVSLSYGNAMERLGPALKEFRKNVFLACKTIQRKAAEVEKELNESLKLMKTDWIDLFQFHAVTVADDVKQIIGPKGALEAVLKARKKGLIRYIGFSAHSEEAAFALIEQFDFDSILFPINWVCWYQGKFGPKVVEEASRRGIAVLALKALAKRKWKENEERKWSKTWYCPVESPEEAKLAMRFTLSLPTTAAVSPGHEELLRWACDAADSFTPLSEEEKKGAEKNSKGLDPIFSIYEPWWKE